MINISEIFRSIQGEGACLGRPSVFIRVSGCNLRCKWTNNDGSETLCDTPYTSHKPERKMRAVNDVIAEVRGGIFPSDHIVITGGEPTLYPDQVQRFVDAFKEKHIITVETNGSNPIALGGVSLWSVSPKLPSSGNMVSLQSLADDILALRRLNPDASFQIKMVISDANDLLMTDALAELVTDPTCIFMLMPQGITAEDIDARLPMIADHALARGYLVTDRMHIRIWGGKRGV